MADPILPPEPEEPPSGDLRLIGATLEDHARRFDQIIARLECLEEQAAAIHIGLVELRHLAARILRHLGEAP